MRIEHVDLKRRILPAIVVIAGLLLPLIPLVKQASSEPLRVGATPTVNCALIYLADSEGFFKKEGIDVVIQDYETGPLAVNDLVADKVDIATAVEIVLVLQSFTHPDLRIPATIGVLSNHDLVVRKDRGITRPQDLKGKRVAVTRGSSSEFFFYTYLIFNRIPAGSVQVVNLAPSEMVKAMADGTIDAAVSWPPYPAEMERQLGAKGARWPAQSGQDAYLLLLAKEGFLKKQPKAMERFLAALSETRRDMLRNIQTGRRLSCARGSRPIAGLSLKRGPAPAWSFNSPRTFLSSWSGRQRGPSVTSWWKKGKCPTI